MKNEINLNEIYSKLPPQFVWESVFTPEQLKSEDFHKYFNIEDKNEH